MKIIAIVSGGMDSVSMAYVLHKQGHDLRLLSFDYGQRHKKEIQYAAQCATDLGIPHDVVDLTAIGKFLTGSSLTDDIAVPDGHYAEESMRITVVPNRNAIMLTAAFGVAYAEKADAVAIANHAGDHYIYPDCRPEFIDNFRAMQKAAGGEMWQTDLVAPFVNMTKAQIAHAGYDAGVDFTKTWSCYKGGDVHCGTCGTCVERKEAFVLSGVSDPTEYK